MLQSFIAAVMVAAAAAHGHQPAGTQQPGDALRVYLADNTSGKDRKDLAKMDLPGDGRPS